VCVIYIRLGTTNSRDELIQVAEAVKAARGNPIVLQLAELVRSVAAAEQNGFESERKRWDRVDPDGQVRRVVAVARTLPGKHRNPGGGVYVYVGEPGPNGHAIWAAVEVGDDGRTLTLARITDRFGGGVREEQGLVQDTLDRLRRGTRFR
jgi:hypothetical protein